MSAIHVIDRFKIPLIAAEILSVALFAGELLYLHRVGTLQPSPLVGMAALLPPLLATLCFFPLCYLAWFRQQSVFAARWLKLSFFWLFAAVAAFIWLNILKTSVGALFQ